MNSLLKQNDQNTFKTNQYLKYLIYHYRYLNLPYIKTVQIYLTNLLE